MRLLNFLLRRLTGLAVVGLSGLTALAAAAPDGYQDAGDGLAWRRDQVKSGPLTYFVVRMDRSRNELRLQPTLAQGNRIGLNTLTSQLALLPADVGKPLAAINGDFYTTEHETFPGDPRGLFITRGELVSAPADRDCFWLDAQGQPHVGEVKAQFSLKWPDGTTTPLGLNEDAGDMTAVLYTTAVEPASQPRGTLPLAVEARTHSPSPAVRVGENLRVRLRPGPRSRNTNGLSLYLTPELRLSARKLDPESTLEISLRTTPDLTGSPVALGGGPALVRKGRTTNPRAVKSNERHPRSALGWNARYYFLTVVDGRQPDWSVGVSLPALAEYMAGLGIEEAINLDGGGSTELWLKGRILNRPCYGHERATATGLAVVRRPPSPADPSGTQATGAENP